MTKQEKQDRFNSRVKKFLNGITPLLFVEGFTGMSQQAEELWKEVDEIMAVKEEN